MVNDFRDSGFVVDEKDWEGMTESQKSWMLFKTMLKMDDRLGRLERKSLFHKACATVGGVLGGAAAAFGVKWWS